MWGWNGTGTGGAKTFCPEPSRYLNRSRNRKVASGRRSSPGLCKNFQNPSIWRRGQSPGGGPFFFRVGAGPGTVRTLNRARAGARAEMLPWSRSRSKPSRLRNLASGHAVTYLRLKILLNFQRHPGCLGTSWPICALRVARTVSQARGTHKDDGGIAQWIPRSGVQQNIRAFRIGIPGTLDLGQPCNHLTKTAIACIECRRSLEGDI